MRPSPLSSSEKWRARVPLPLLVFTTAALVVVRVVRPIMSSTHDDSLQLTIHSPNFMYKVTTYHNNDANRCAFIRCGLEIAPRYLHHTTCDLVFVSVMKTKKNASSSYCIVDYVHSQWESLSRRYNHGFTYLSDSTVLRVPARELPLDANAVHMSTMPNNLDLSTSWLSAWPSNATRAVFRDWYDDIPKVSPKTRSREYVSLNRVRNCSSADVECHLHMSSIAWQCDGSHNKRECLSAAPFMEIAWQTVLVAITVVVSVMTVAVTFSSTIPRLRSWLRLSRYAALNSLPVTPTLMFVFIVTLAGEDWVTIVRLIARAVGVSFAHTLDSQPFSSDTDVYRAVPGLRGVHDGYAYLFRDGGSMVRVGGPGVTLVVNLVSIVLFFKRVVYDGFLVRCVTAMMLVRMGCDAIIAVVGRSKLFAGSEEDDEEEYLSGRGELSTMQLGRSRGRSFVLTRESASKSEMGLTKGH